MRTTKKLLNLMGYSTYGEREGLCARSNSGRDFRLPHQKALLFVHELGAPSATHGRIRLTPVRIREGFGHLRRPRKFILENKFSEEGFLAKCRMAFLTLSGSNSLQLCQFKNPPTWRAVELAEREGFEPSRPFRAWRFSRPLESTTIRPLQSE